MALGAAVQAGIIAGEEINSILVDVTPISLGIETAHIGMSGHLDIDHFAPLIRRNSTIPVQKSEIFTTMYPGQDKIEIKVYQGESRVASQNVLLGDFMVEDVKASRPDGLAEVTVDFQIDINGILNVTVTERGSGRKTTEQLKADRQRLSPEQIAESQAKLAALYSADEDEDEDEDGEFNAAEVEIEFDAGTMALLERARRALETPGLSADLDAQLRATIDNISDAAAEGDEEQLQAYCDNLIDLLFEAEE